MSHTEPSRPAAPARHRATGAHRLPPGARARIRHIGRRSRTVALTGLAIAALGIGGAATALTYPDEPGQNDPTTVTTAGERTTDEQAAIDERADTAQRADRSERRATAEPGGQAGFGPADATPTPSGTTSAAAPTDAATPTEAGTDAGADAPADSGAATAAAATAPDPTPSASPDWVTPMPGAQITSCYGQRWGVLHAGMDLAMPAGTPVLAAGAGTVTVAGWAYTGYGISVVIDHGNGLLTHYAHLSATSVAVGDKVAPGDQIGQEGSTGDSTGPHLHFEVHVGGLWSQVDPAPWLRERGVDLGC
ncbi:M23 family metallopeptidase [Solwaraspora sp. WMMA2056]|uniref:M23 family metallopeptidase n=1 Tax=Solwaraspora sp. WMMA2056 TaxID=3015161 RepID=UPI00259B2B0D|nr:M23 family metallopeptidase [Solwaraspora sp. WMMA2056]WJK42391.1 M23 family metallopeptidase [Solwaraspora sp. WMMA2056]